MDSVTTPDGGSAAGCPIAATLSPEFRTTAHQHYERLRAAGPVQRVRQPSGLEVWLVVGQQAVREAAVHPALVKDAATAQEALDAIGFTGNKPGSGFGGNMLSTDPPHHTRLRKLVAGAFTGRRTELLRPRVQEIADQLLDAMAPAGRADLVDAFAGPLPMTVICELLGVPEEHREDFRSWSHEAITAPVHLQREGAAKLSQYLAELLAAKRENPDDGLLSALVAVNDEQDGRLSDVELLGTAVLLVVAGHDTTVNLLANAALALLTHPEQAELLRNDPALLPGAVEEFLRFDAPVEFAPFRFAAEDLELAGTKIRRGDIVQLGLTAAGRDSEGGDVLDVTRPDPRHVSFGHGIHYCLGAPLARLEGEIAIGTLLRRFPDLELAIPAEEVRWHPYGITRGPVELPVRWGR
jgi:cytochrome P450